MRRSPSDGLNTFGRHSRTRHRGRRSTAPRSGSWTAEAVSNSPCRTRISYTPRGFPVTRTDGNGTILIADYDFGDVDIERAIIEGAGFQLIAEQCKIEDEVIEKGRDADGVLTQYVRIGSRAIDAFTRCRVIARYGTGVDIVDVDAATRQGEWHWKTGRPIRRLRGRVFGLLSFGYIARLIAERAKGFGVEVWAHDPFLDEPEIRSRDVRPVSFDDLVEGADYLVIQSPLTPQTHHAFDRATLHRMKPTAILINTGRGPIVDDAAIYQALTEGWIAGAALDDLEEEPAKQRDWRPTNSLLQSPNVVVTPHAAYYSEESIGLVRRIAAEEAVRVLTGQPARSPVNDVTPGSHPPRTGFPNLP